MFSKIFIYEFKNFLISSHILVKRGNLILKSYLYETKTCVETFHVKTIREQNLIFKKRKGVFGDMNDRPKKRAKIEDNGGLGLEKGMIFNYRGRPHVIADVIGRGDKEEYVLENKETKELVRVPWKKLFSEKSPQKPPISSPSKRFPNM